jgi:hypothetical protein
MKSLIINYYLGIVLCFIIGIVITPFYFVVLGAIRLFHCVLSTIVDSFLLVPIIVEQYRVKFWDK